MGHGGRVRPISEAHSGAADRAGWLLSCGMRRLGRYRWSTAAAGAVLLLVLFVVTWALRLDHGRRVSQTEVTATVTTPPARTTPSALIVGDSYTAGTGAGSSRGDACRAAAAMAWSCNLDTQGGTGYVNDGSINSLDFEPFIDRLPGDRTRFFADIVIMDGGRNDGGLYPMAQILAASDTYLRAVHELWPARA